MGGPDGFADADRRAAQNFADAARVSGRRIHPTSWRPIGIEDLLDYLLAAGSLQQADSAVFEIGGPDRVSYAEIMNEYARQRGLRRALVRVPAVSRRASTLWLSLITPVYSDIGRAMLDSLRNDTTVADPSALDVLPTVRAPFSRRSRGLCKTRTSSSPRPAGPMPRTARAMRLGGSRTWPSADVSRMAHIPATAADAFAAIQRLGGETGWYHADHFWRARGRLDKLAGGVGLRRGRRHPVHVATGDTLDFWRVERFGQDRLLRLAAEMKAPGRIWLQFEVEDAPGGATLCQTAIFESCGDRRPRLLVRAVSRAPCRVRRHAAGARAGDTAAAADADATPG